MTKPQLLLLLQLLAAMESLLAYQQGKGVDIPKYLSEMLSTCVDLLEQEILK